MNKHENLEAELRRLKPAVLPPELMARLAAVTPPKPVQATGREQAAAVGNTWRLLFRWLVPATAGAALLATVLISQRPKRDVESKAVTPGPDTAKTTLKPDAVQIDRELVAAYDAVAELPGGEPVRFRCREWMDAVVLRDAANGVRIEQHTPRFEVVAARLDTF